MVRVLAAALLLSLAGRTGGCPQLLTNTCVCLQERSKAHGGPQLRRKVVCSKQELVEVPDSNLLPNRTVHLILSNNKIALLKAGAFSGLRALEKLDLRSNLISTIQVGAFSGLTSLKRLDLSDNRIGCLNAGMFQSLTNLVRLNISGNIFSTLNPDLLDGLASLKVIDFNTEYLVCDCNVLWVLNWERRKSVRISEETLCAFPKALSGKPFKDLKESQLVCDGPLELPILQLIPVLRQVVFQGDRLPLMCTATYLDNSTRVLWYHNGVLVQPEEENGVVIMESHVHDCSLISSELVLSNIYLLASGEWECVVATSRGNASLKVEVVVIDTSATYCQAERVTNNRGDFRWPRTLAGITVYQPCLQYPYPSSSLERKTSRKCNRSGMWEEADYSACLYINDYTRVLSSFILIPINNTNALPLARKLLAYTAEATNFLDMMDVIYVTQMIEKFIRWTEEIHDLGDVIVEVASNMMLVNEQVLRLAQEESGACTRIVWAVEHIANLTLTFNSQTISKVSTNIALEAFLVKPASYSGLSCTAFQRRLLVSSLEGQAQGLPHPLQFRCSTGSINSSLTHFPVKNSIALASVRLPPALFAHSSSPLSHKNSSCWLQFVAFRNGKLFPSTGNSSNLADHGKERSPSTPVIFAGTGGCGVGSLTDPLLVSLRHWHPGEDQVAAHWNFDLLGGFGGWQAAGCQIAHTNGNVSTLWCRQFSNVAVLKRISNHSVAVHESIPILHPVIYTCTVFLLLCLFTAIVAYILRHNTIRISRKSWHMLLNLWFHISMTCAVFSGGINRKEYVLLCQVVGILLHYSSLSTLLWIGVSARVIYKEATQNLQRQHELELPAPAQRPMLRFYLIAGGIPLIICGITAAVNLHNYSNISPYCWLAWKPSLGAFYVPAGFTVLVSWIYFLGAGLHLGCRRRNKGEAPGSPEQPALGSSRLSDSGSASLGSESPSLATENVYSLEAQLWALLSTQLLFVGLWSFGALAVSGPSLAMLFSYLYGVGAVALGLLVLIHHCLKRCDVCGPWLPCAKGPVKEAGSLAAASPAKPELKVPSATGDPFSASGPCKLTNIQAALSQGERAATRSSSACGDSEPEAPPCRRGHRTRTKPPQDGKQARQRAPRATASDAASSENGSVRLSNGRAAREGSGSPSEGSDSSSQVAGLSLGLQACLSLENRRPASAFEREVKRRSYPLNATNQNGALQGSRCDVTPFGAEAGAGINTGLWKSETTV
ncbi:adhesion G protein-coupled receptor A2 [Mobula hypostoma]|uniref:adhesion G protein-coupled receptor A2 n=1 Tax=Mobula hypostoma TaxID=723540 RepID=UPI002FC32FBE